MDKNSQPDKNTYFLNPASIKIKNSFGKKSRLKPQSSINFAKTQQSPPHKPQVLIKKSGFNPEQHLLSIKHSKTTSLQMSKKKEEERKSHRFSKSTIHEQQYSFVIDRNKYLMQQLKNRQSKIEHLDRKCEILEMKLISKHIHHNSLDNKNIKLTMKYDIPNGISPSNRMKMKSLRSIQERLQKVNFDSVLENLRKYQPKYRHQ